MHKLTIALLAALLSSGLSPGASAGEQAGGPEMTRNAYAPPDMSWRFNRTARGPRLAYGEPATDNVRLMLRCAGDGVTVQFIRPTAMVRRLPEHLTLASGGMRWRAGLSAEDTELGGMTVTASAPVSSAVMMAFGAGRPLEVRWDEETIGVPGTDAAKDFLAACG